MQYADFFEAVTGYRPYPYQAALAEGPWPTVLDVPTGLGKTAAVVVAWLWRRLRGDSGTGRRLVYCLPMRVLVEQVQGDAEAWCARAEQRFAAAERARPEVHLLMGGAVAKAKGWDERPGSDAILVGTQDMLLSRALNRGYGMSRYRWPLAFGLLNGDCQWVFDETQLMGVAVETSAQLHGLRRALGTYGPAGSLWMSATLGQGQLDTVDHARPASGWPRHALTEADRQHERVRQRTEAKKRLARLDAAVLDKKSQAGHAAAVAAEVLAAHQQRGGLTLVVVNRVERAQELRRALLKAGLDATALALVHARFRRGDRSQHERFLDRDRTDDRVVVATQAVEAGVDVSARTLFTELAPWPSLVQRMGRCNRYGEVDDAAVRWIDIDSDDKDGLALPYDAASLNEARALLGRVAESGGDAGPASLGRIEYQPPEVVRPVLRRRDVLDLFDTTPDLCGNDVDVSRFVRDGDDTDCRVFWRELSADGPGRDLSRARREELCPVSIRAINEFLPKLARKRPKAGKELAPRLRAWVWDGLDEQWAQVDRARPGQEVLLDVVAGGYDPALGWTGEVMPKLAVPEIVPAAGEDTGPAESMAGDPDTATGCWVPLTAHLGHVEAEAGRLAEGLGLPGLVDLRDVLAVAGRWHDVGKAHPAFQQKLLGPLAENELPSEPGPWAKSGHNRRWERDERPGFRHELASALAWLAAAENPAGGSGIGDGHDQRDIDLIAYLVAAHHGKVRLSIRSLPNEPAPREPGRLFARGVWDGEELPAVTLPTGDTLGPIALDLSCMQLGAGSWLERTLALRDDPALGPFRLAVLEGVVRIADWRASHKEQTGGYPNGGDHA
ncbi:type I-G CRISPR-associated helicase/endonuclease Cas3g [Haliangium sp.]|uniref:type I-G CRISPR-associated helicase/endonuclease Cas3g n=1 Tax=Haliangium sp. TaxID=2663208 RepID=UPI003D09A046